MDPIKPEDVTDEAKKMMARQAHLRYQNAQMVAEIEAMGRSVDVANSRIDHMWLVLYHAGVLNPTQIAEFQLDFEEDLRRTLKVGLEQVREDFAKEQQRARQNKARQLALPPSVQAKKTLIIPGRGEVVIGETRPEGGGS